MRLEEVKADAAASVGRHGMDGRRARRTGGTSVWLAGAAQDNAACACACAASVCVAGEHKGRKRLLDERSLRRVEGNEAVGLPEMPEVPQDAVPKPDVAFNAWISHVSVAWYLRYMVANIRSLVLIYARPTTAGSTRRALVTVTH